MEIKYSKKSKIAGEMIGKFFDFLALLFLLNILIQSYYQFTKTPSNYFPLSCQQIISSGCIKISQATFFPWYSMINA